MKVSGPVFTVVALAAVVSAMFLPPGSVHAAPVQIPAFLLLNPQERPFDNLLWELLYQDLMTIAEEEDLEVYELVVLVALTRQRFIHSLNRPLPVIPLAGGWRLEPIPLDERPFLFPEIEELYRELKEAQAEGTLDARDAAILAFIERTRERFLMPMYELVSSPQTRSLGLAGSVAKSVVVNLPPIDSPGSNNKALVEPWDYKSVSLSGSTMALMSFTDGQQEPVEQWMPAPAGPAIPEPGPLAMFIAVALTCITAVRVAGRRL